MVAFRDLPEGPPEASGGTRLRPFDVGAGLRGSSSRLVLLTLGRYLYFSSLEGLRAQTVAVLGHLEPLSAAICALAFLGKPMSFWEAVGGTLIIGGAMLGTIPQKKPEAPA